MLRIQELAFQSSPSNSLDQEHCMSLAPSDTQYPSFAQARSLASRDGGPDFPVFLTSPFLNEYRPYVSEGLFHSRFIQKSVFRVTARPNSVDIL